MTEREGVKLGWEMVRVRRERVGRERERERGVRVGARERVRVVREREWGKRVRVRREVRVGRECEAKERGERESWARERERG